MENALPLSFSIGNDIIRAPWAAHNKDAHNPRMAPARMRNQRFPVVWWHHRPPTYCPHGGFERGWTEGGWVRGERDSPKRILVNR
jgi:hypothetical protein